MSTASRRRGVCGFFEHRYPDVVAQRALHAGAGSRSLVFGALTDLSTLGCRYRLRNIPFSCRPWPPCPRPSAAADLLPAAGFPIPDIPRDLAARGHMCLPWTGVLSVQRVRHVSVLRSPLCRTRVLSVDGPRFLCLSICCWTADPSLPFGSYKLCCCKYKLMDKVLCRHMFSVLLVS